MSEEQFVNGAELGKIIPVDITDEVKKAFIDYSMSVITDRALPDVRDGLKPVHRRILYTMYEMNLYPNVAYRKSATTVGAVLGSYHPHGDASVYDAMVRMAQDFSLRYMLVDGHGNFGSIDGYPAAAYRYTESRMSKMAMSMLEDIDKETVDYRSNFDDTKKEPIVLPARVPNLLINGSSGIAVGMATNIPPHNLAEVVDGMCCMIDNPDCTLEDIMEYIKAPDFPTGGIIMGYSGIKAAYQTGRGKITVRAKTETEEVKPGKFNINITEIPYMVNKKVLVKSIADIIADKKIEGIEDIVDYSDKGGIKIVIELKKDANVQVVLNHLFQQTQLQTTFGANIMALVNGEPKQLNLMECLRYYIDHQCEVVERRTAYILRKAKERAHILEALKTAVDFIDEVIKIIRAASNQNEAKEKLAERFGFDDIQTSAIVAMRLGQLTGLEREKIESELEEKRKTIAECEEILADHTKVLDIVRNEALNTRDKFADNRRTEIVPVSGDVDIEDLIPEGECIITKTNAGYIKRLPVDTYSAQHRGGRGITGMTTREGDLVEDMYTCSTHDYILMFTSMGRVYRIKAYEIPEAARTAKGMNMVNLLELKTGEKVLNILNVGQDLEDGSYICMVTKNGTLKRTPLDSFKNIRKTGIIAIGLDEGDELAFVRKTDGNENLLVATRGGRAIRFNENDAREMGRTARGVRAIKVMEGDQVVSMTVAADDTKVLTVSSMGYGRRSDATDYRVQTRGGKGITNYRTEQYGEVVEVMTVADDDDVILMSTNGVVIRLASTEISKFNRPSKGVRIMKPDDGEAVLSASTAKHAEEIEEELETEESAETQTTEAPTEE